MLPRASAVQVDVWWEDVTSTPAVARPNDRLSKKCSFYNVCYTLNYIIDKERIMHLILVDDYKTLMAGLEIRFVYHYLCYLCLILFIIT